MRNVKPYSEVKRIIAAFGHAACGLKESCAQPAFCIELVVAAVLVPASLWLGKSGAERGLLIGSVMLVPVVELLNTGIEAAIDRISLERHPLSKRAKDAGSAAVLMSIVSAALVWLAVLWK